MDKARGLEREWKAVSKQQGESSIKRAANW